MALYLVFAKDMVPRIRDAFNASVDGWAVKAWSDMSDAKLEVAIFENTQTCSAQYLAILDEAIAAVMAFADKGITIIGYRGPEQAAAQRLVLDAEVQLDRLDAIY
jgi:hypothetical protein